MPRLLVLAALAALMLATLTPGQQPPPLKLSAEDQAKLQERDRLWQEAKNLHDAGKLAEVIAVLQQVLAIERSVLGADARKAVLTLEILSRVHEDQGDFAAARKTRAEVLQIKNKRLGQDHWEVTDARLALANTDMVLRMTADQRDQYRLAWELNLQLNRLRDAGKSQEALPVANRILEIRKQVVGETHPHYALSLNNLAVIQISLGDYAKAEPLLRQVLEINKALLTEKHPDYTAALENLASLYDTQGDYAKAGSLYRQALAVLKAAHGANHRAYANVLGNLSVVHANEGRLADAERLGLQALRIHKATVGEKHRDYAMSLANLASLYQTYGDYPKAEALYHQVTELHRVTLGDRHPDYASSLGNLANLYSAKREYTKAEPLLLEALRIHQGTQGDNLASAQLLHQLAFLHSLQEQYAQAEPLYLKAFEIRKAILGEKHHLYANSMHNLAALRASQGDYEAAATLYHQVSEILKQSTGDKHYYYAITLCNLARLYRSRNDPLKGEPLCQQALRITRAYVDLAAAGQSERQQLLMSESVRYQLNSYLSLVLQAGQPGGAAFDEVLLWKGATFLRQFQTRLYLADPNLAPLATELRSVAARLATLALTVPRPEQRSTWARQIAELTITKEQLETELARRSAEFRQRQQRGKLTGADLATTLPAGTILVDYLQFKFSSPDPENKGRFKFEDRLAAFIVRPGAAVELLDLGPIAPIAKHIDQWRKSLTKPVAANVAAAELRLLLWQPLEKHLQGAKQVFISPDGVLGTLPFAALPGSKKGTYLIEEVPLVVIPVPQLLPELLGEKPSAEKPSLLLVGGVDFGAEASLAEERGSQAAPTGSQRRQWGYLKGTAAEVDSLGKLFADHQKGDVRVLRGASATEQALRQDASKHRILHLATHGFFAPPEVKSALARDLNRPEASLLGDGDLTGRSSISGWNPGLLSGIVLAGANREPVLERDDGILTAIEVASLDLRKVELAVLSACETGLGQSAGGEGLLGLQRAFQVAGAKTVVASLWQVPDQGTRVLMERFYRNLWEKKLPRLDALREAQLWMLREGKKHPDVARGLELIDEPLPKNDGRLPPYYWAAFVLSGDWR